MAEPIATWNPEKMTWETGRVDLFGRSESFSAIWPTTGVPDLSRNEQLKALGNGVVPQQAALALQLLGVVDRQVVAA